MASPSIRPHMLVADEQGNIYDHPDFLLLCRRGEEWSLPRPDELMPLPEESELFLLPGRRAVGLNPETGETEVMEDWAVAAFAAPAHTLTAHPVYMTDEGAPMLPLFAYGAVGFANGRFYVCAKKVDEDVRQVFKGISRGKIDRSARKIIEDFPDNSRCGLVQHDLPVCTALVPQRLPAVRHALVGVVVQTAGDVLCHVLAVKLVDIHHVPQCKTPGGSIVKIFLGVKHLYAVIVQLCLVDHGLQHIAPDAVGLPRHDGLKLPFFSIPHHLLETRPVIRLAADCPVLVCTNNAQSKRSRVLRTLCDLLLDADLSLVM